MTALDLDALLALREQATAHHGDSCTYCTSAFDIECATEAILEALPELVAKAREADRLRQWKAEAIEVIEGWEAVWEALGRPGRVGQSKSAAVLAALSPSDGGDQ